MTHNFKEPYFLVDFHASICNFEILINDMPAFASYRDVSVASQAPINHLICSSGEQRIQIRVFPVKRETTLRTDSSLAVKVHYYDAAGDIEQFIPVLNFNTPDLADPKLPIVEYQGVFKAEVPYKQLGWQESIELNQEEAFLEHAINFYKKIYTLVREENYTGFLKVMNQRLSDIDEATFIYGADNVAEWNGLVSNLKEGQFVLQDFPEETISRLYGNKKVLNITRTDGLPVLTFKNEDNETFNFPFLIHKKSGAADFEIIR